MAPSKASGTTAKKTRTVSLGGTPPSALKQGKLDFSSLKRNTSASTSAKEKVVSKVGVEPTSAKTSPKAVATKLFSEKEAITKRTETTSPASSPTLYSSSVAERPQKRAKTSDASLSPPISINIDESSSEEEPDEPEDLDVLEKSGKLRRYLGQVKEKTGNVPPSRFNSIAFQFVCRMVDLLAVVHGDKTRDSVNILRVFDLYVTHIP